MIKQEGGNFAGIINTEKKYPPSKNNNKEGKMRISQKKKGWGNGKDVVIRNEAGN